MKNFVAFLLFMFLMIALIMTEYALNKSQKSYFCLRDNNQPYESECFSIGGKNPESLKINLKIIVEPKVVKSF